MATQTWRGSGDAPGAGARLASAHGALLRWSILLLVVGAAIWWFAMQHAVERHGETAVKIEACFNQGKVLQKWVKPDGRIMYACDVPDICSLGIVVTEMGPNGEEIVTCFQNKSKTLERLENYFRNHNAVKEW